MQTHTTLAFLLLAIGQIWETDAQAVACGESQYLYLTDDAAPGTVLAPLDDPPMLSGRLTWSIATDIFELLVGRTSVSDHFAIRDRPGTIPGVDIVTSISDAAESRGIGSIIELNVLALGDNGNCWYDLFIVRREHFELNEVYINKKINETSKTQVQIAEYDIVLHPPATSLSSHEVCDTSDTSLSNLISLNFSSSTGKLGVWADLVQVPHLPLDFSFGMCLVDNARGKIFFNGTFNFTSYHGGTLQRNEKIVVVKVPGNRTSTITCGQQCNVLGTERTGTTNTGRLFCDCKPGVKGACCDECQENTFENPTIANCATCRCNIPGTIRCNKKDGSCTCRDGVEGKLCNRCKADYYTEKARDYSTCKPCTCHPDGSQSCDSQTGSCDCKPGVIGNDCDRCRDLFYPRGGNFDQCVACPCLAKGTQACTVSGSCTCIANVTGSRCNKCEFGFFGHPRARSGCRQCTCHLPGTLVCAQFSGRCQCRRRSTGVRCDRCEDGFYAPANRALYLSLCKVRGCVFLPNQACQDCTCHPKGSVNMLCASDGSCNCKPGVTGPKCDSCPDGQIFTDDGKCTAPSNWIPFGRRQSDSSLGAVAQSEEITIALRTGIAIGEPRTIHREVTLSSSGYVALSSVLPQNPSLNSIQQLRGVPVIAPLWLQGDGRFSRVQHQLHTDAATLKQASDYIQAHPDASDLQPEFVLKVTWSGVRESPAGQEAADSGLRDVGANNFQLVIIWDDCVAFSIFLYNTVQWKEHRNGQPAISAIWDGKNLLRQVVDTSETKPIVTALTQRCSGSLLNLRTCRQLVRALPSIDVPAFTQRFSATQCPPDLFSNNFFPRWSLSFSDGAQRCYRRQVNNFGNYAPVCCYTEGAGTFRTGASGGWITTATATSVDVERNELNAKKQCCTAGDCELFFRARPATSANSGLQRRPTPPPRPRPVPRPRPRPPSNFWFNIWRWLSGWFHGDPHVRTLDGVDYTFNGYGEYLMIDADHFTTKTNVVVQARTTPLPGITATVFTHAAIGIYTFGEAAGNKPASGLLTSVFVSSVQDGFSIIVDKSTEVSAEVFELDVARLDGVQPNEFMTMVHTGHGAFSISFFNGLRVGFAFNNATSIPSMTLSTALTPDFYGDTFGLLGVFNNDIRDDFVNREGIELPSNSSEEVLFYQFGQTWQIKPEESLFIYEAGLGPEDYAHPEHIPVFTNSLKISDEVRQVCDGRVECMFDAAATNDTAVGLNTKLTGEVLEEERKLAENIPPSITGGARIDAYLGKLVVYRIQVEDLDDFNVTLETTGNTVYPADYNFTRTYKGDNSSTFTLYWLPVASDMSLSFQFVALDANNASSIHHPLVTYCPCANQQTCIDLQGGEDGGESQFLVRTCICNMSYSGELCDADRDGCISGTGCYSGVTCTDNPAPAAGATCGLCPSGLTGDGVMCSDVLECSNTPTPCSQYAKCTEVFSAFKCDCLPGFVGDGTECADVDECVDEVHSCSPLASCINTDGSYICTCNMGYSGNGTSCEDEDECDIHIDECNRNALCRNTAGSYTCSCTPGYRGDGIACSDIDECQEASPCHVNAICRNSLGNYTCECDVGYTGSGVHCEDIDECGLGNFFCSSKAVCVNTLGGYQCRCMPGYIGSGSVCFDDDECSRGTSNCSTDATCSNTNGGFTCACPFHLTGDGYTCSQLACPHPDFPNGELLEEGPFDVFDFMIFICNPGYSIVGIPEAICLPPGEPSSPTPSCQNIDECQDRTHNCDRRSTCVDTDGSYICQCPHGFTGTGLVGGCEVNTDECNVGIHNCPDTSDCINTPEYFTCQCREGYTGDGYSCSNIDECNEGLHQCNTNASCTDLLGSYSCHCVHGYTGDGISCTNVNECSIGQHNCHTNARCVDTAGSYTCECSLGYTGDGISQCSENYCLPDNDCAHYYNYGEVEAGSCPSCRTKLSACEGVTCKPIRECIRYSAQVLEGECCFSCERYREFIDRDPRKLCRETLCPRGSVCTRRFGNFVACVCKKCLPVNDPALQVRGLDGRVYASECHLTRESCLRRVYLGQ